MKKFSPFRILLPLLAFAALTGANSSARAQSAPFTLDPARSHVTISGTVAGNPFREQGPNSLTTSFSGTINADATPSSISFPGGSVLDAAENGSWQPAVGGGSGAAPADYGAVADSFIGTIKAALRNIILDLSSASIPVTGGGFPATNLVFSFPDNSSSHFDYNAGFASGSRTFAGHSTNQTATVATLAATGGTEVLTIDIDTTFAFRALSADDSSLHLLGQLVATRAAAPPAARLSSVTVANGVVRIEAEGADASYRLESSADLVHWSPAPATTAVAGGKIIYTIPQNGDVQFYRLIKTP